MTINQDHLLSARPVSAGTLDPVEVKVLETFVSRKLVVKDFVSKEAFYQPSHEELLRWPTLSDYIEQHRTDLTARDELERTAELWTLGRREVLGGADLAHARYLEHRGLASSRLKALIDASRVSERPRYWARVARYVILSYGWYFALFLPGEILLPFFSQGNTASLIAFFLVLITEVLLYVFLVRRKFRVSRYGYFRLDGRPCDVKGYAARWLLGPAGLVMTPLTRCFGESRLTWVDRRTETELVAINRDGSRRYEARSPSAV